MRIFIATGLYPPESGGPATYTKLLQERLPARGFSVSVLPFRSVRHLPKGVRHAAYFFMCLCYAAAADVVYAQDTVSVGLPALLAARVCGKPFVVRVPGDYAWEQARGGYGVRDELDEFQTKRYGPKVERLRSLQRYVVGRARLVVAPSEYLKRVALGWGASPERVRVVYNGIDLTLPAEEPGERPQGFLVVSSGRRVPWKGFEALERVVAGEPGWHLHIAEKVSRAQALGWAKAADVYALNSTYEGLSHALLEVMALGTPIVATAVGGNPELVRDGVDGILVPVGDEQALRTALKRVHDDPEAARARAGSARARVEEFSVDRTLDKLCELFKTLG